VDLLSQILLFITSYPRIPPMIAKIGGNSPVPVTNLSKRASGISDSFPECAAQSSFFNLKTPEVFD